MSEAEDIAREHVRWAVGEDGRSVAQVVLEAGHPLPRWREPCFEDAVRAVMQAWLTLYCDEILEAA